MSGEHRQIEQSSRPRVRHKRSRLIQQRKYHRNWNHRASRRIHVANDTPNDISNSKFMSDSEDSGSGRDHKKKYRKRSHRPMFDIELVSRRLRILTQVLEIEVAKMNKLSSESKNTSPSKNTQRTGGPGKSSKIEFCEKNKERNERMKTANEEALHVNGTRHCKEQKAENLNNSRIQRPTPQLLGSSSMNFAQNMLSKQDTKKHIRTLNLNQPINPSCVSGQVFISLQLMST